MKDLHIIDLISQRNAVRCHLRNMAKDEIVDWLAKHGHLTKREILNQEVFYFESFVGLRARFVFDENELIFLADHTTFF